MIKGKEEHSYVRGNQVDTAKALQKVSPNSPPKNSGSKIVKDNSGRSVKLNDLIPSDSRVRRKGTFFSKHMQF